MPPISPDSEGRKRKDSFDLLKRDQHNPLFTTRRSVLSQQPPDFFTDSLNTSSIPIPSPTKENIRPSAFWNSRPKLGSRSLAASFQATPEANDENKRPSSSPSLDRRSTTYLPRIRPAQTTSRSLAKSPSRPSSRLPRAKTPSPERGRQYSIVSPASSASSPPRGLAEAYQRINDEESLAQEDSIEGDMETMTYDYASQERSREIDRVRMQRIQEAVSPIKLKATRKPLPRLLSEELRDAMARGQAMEGNWPELDNESAGSNLENLTGSVNEEVSQHAKDLARVNDVVNSETKVFTKARPSNRLGVTVENLTRRNGSNESLSSARGAGSTSSKGSNPSLNVPRKWARKATPAGTNWLNRIKNKNGRLTGDTPEKNHANSTGSEGSDQKEPLEEWVTTAKEDQNPSEGDRPASRGSTPTAAHRKQSIDRVSEWEINDDDFTGRSLQVSDSPPIRTLGPILEREIDSVAKRAVTTSRLGEIREKTLEEHTSRRTYSQSAEDLSKSGIESNRETSRQRRSSLKIPFKPFVGDKSYSSISGAVLGSGGDSIPDSPVTIYRNTSDVSISDNGLGGNMDDDRRSVHRPKHEQGDSRELLRKIARASSQSPTSAKEGPSPASPLSQQELIPPDTVEPDEEPSGFGIRTDLSVQAAEEDNHGGNNHVPDAPIEKLVQETPRPHKSNADLKTPLVTGAWIDTPLPTGSHGLPLPTPANLEDDEDFTVDSEDQSRRIAATDLIRKLNPNILPTRPRLNSQMQLKDTGPLLPKSALESILAAAKANPKPVSQRNRGTNSTSDSEELELGDSTMQSLEEILHDDPDRLNLASQSSSSPFLPNEDLAEDEELEDNFLKSDHSAAEPLTSDQGSLSELKSYARQIRRLGNVGPSIRDTKRRLAVLEKAFSKTVSDLPSRSLEIQNGCDEAGEFHDFIWPCERCGCPGRRDSDPSYRIARYIDTVSASVPKLWRWRRDDWRPRLTWLGLMLLVWWAWWIGDWYACKMYCHPRFAKKKYFGYGVDINSPRPPFVLFKVIDRLCRETSFIRPVYVFFSLLVRAVFSVLGYLVGFAMGDDGGETRGGRPRPPASRDPRIPRPTWGPDLSMMNDEYL